MIGRLRRWWWARQSRRYWKSHKRAMFFEPPVVVMQGDFLQVTENGARVVLLRKNGTAQDLTSRVRWRVVPK